MYKVLLVSLVLLVGKSQSSVENGKWGRRDTWPGRGNPHVDLDQRRKQVLLTLFGFRPAQGSP